MKRFLTVEIRNLPEKDKESTEDLVTIVTNLGKAVNTIMQPADLRDVFRVPAKPSSIRNIVVDFRRPLDLL